MNSRPPNHSEQDALYLEATSEYSSALARLATGYEANTERRRDLLQEIHIGLWKSLANFDARCSLRTWVYRIGHNIAVNHIVRDKRHSNMTQVTLEDLEEQEHLEGLADNADAATDVDKQNVLARMHAMIYEMKMPDRQIMLLYLDDVDAESIAQIVGMSASNVATKIHRIKQLLARHFQARGGE